MMKSLRKRCINWKRNSIRCVFRWRRKHVEGQMLSKKLLGCVISLPSFKASLQWKSPTLTEPSTISASRTRTISTWSTSEMKKTLNLANNFSNFKMISVKSALSLKSLPLRCTQWNRKISHWITRSTRYSTTKRLHSKRKLSMCSRREDNALKLVQIRW